MFDNCQLGFERGLLGGIQVGSSTSTSRVEEKLDASCVTLLARRFAVAFGRTKSEHRSPLRSTACVTCQIVTGPGWGFSLLLHTWVVPASSSRAVHCRSTSPKAMLLRPQIGAAMACQLALEVEAGPRFGTSWLHSWAVPILVTLGRAGSRTYRAGNGAKHLGDAGGSGVRKLCRS